MASGAAEQPAPHWARLGESMLSHSKPIRSAFVLGSTSHVAVAICRELSRRGCRRFFLVARNSARNAELAEELRNRHGAEVELSSLDLLAEPANSEAAARLLRESFDLYLITAGSLGDALRARFDAGEALAVTTANYSGLLPWLTAIVSAERIERPGRLWVFSSVAADRGRPSNYHYGAAKAALTTFCEGLLLRCQGKPFTIRILKAGFMATPMTIGKAPPALCASPDSVARDLLRRPDRRGIEYIPWWWCLIMFLVRLLPPALAAKL
jgi:decaprenylphospho-beta-D-erythro-pentofuranosid-2-ulose 2-reductase